MKKVVVIVALARYMMGARKNELPKYPTNQGWIFVHLLRPPRNAYTVHRGGSFDGGAEVSQCTWCFGEGMGLVVVRMMRHDDTETQAVVCQKCVYAFHKGRSSGIYETIRRSRTEALE